jgi:hypothetical protein
MNRLQNIFWLGTKELRGLQRDRGGRSAAHLSFTVAIYTMATGTSSEVHNASIALVDEDRSTSPGRSPRHFYPPYFRAPPAHLGRRGRPGMDRGRFMFVLDIPPRFRPMSWPVASPDPGQHRCHRDVAGEHRANYIARMLSSEIHALRHNAQR